MKLRHLLLPVAVIASSAPFANQPAAQSQDVRAAYDRAESLNRRTQGLVVGDIQAVSFLPDSTKLWYRKTVSGGHEFVLADAVARTKAPAFDHARLATSLSAATKGTYVASALPLTGLRFVTGMQAIEFSLPPDGGRGPAAAGGQGGPAGPAPGWQCSLTDYTCTRLPSAPAQDQPGSGQGPGGAGRAAGPGVPQNQQVRL